MRAKPGPWVRSGTLLIAMAAGLFAAGDAFRYLAEENIARQTQLFSGVKVEMNEDITVENIHNSDVKALISDHHFFLDQTVEPEAVKDIKRRVSPILDGQYFSSIWDVFWYLRFLGDYDALFTAYSTAIDDGAFADDPRCADQSKCDSPDGANVDFESGSQLFPDLKSTYSEPALAAYKHLSIGVSQSLAADGLSLIRRIHFRTSAFGEGDVLDAYNNVIAIGAFLTKPVTATNALSSHDLELLSDTISTHDSDVLQSDADDPDLRAYVSGLMQLRSGCYIEASQIFFDHINTSTYEPISEIFAFLALRSLARPFVAIDALTPDNSASIVVTDCKKPHQAKEFIDLFRDRSLDLQGFMHYPGLKADTEFYSDQLPTDPNKMKELIERVRQYQASRAPKQETDPGP